MAKQIGYARVSTKNQITDRQQADLLAAGVRRDDLYIDHGVSGARASSPQFDAAIIALHDGDALVVTTLDRLGRSTTNLLALPAENWADGVDRTDSWRFVAHARGSPFSDYSTRSMSECCN